MTPVRIAAFEPRLAALLPATAAWLRSANLTVHPAVRRVTLHGSRGLAGSSRPGSDIDLSLLVDPPPGDLESGLRSVLDTTLSNWRAAIEPDLAVIFEIRGCGLKCFEHEAWSEAVCAQGGLDCFGLFKTQRGFNGLVTNAGVQVRRMYPCLTIWRR